MRLSIELIGDKQIIAHFAQLPVAVQEALYRKVSELVLRLEALVKQKLSGGVLHVGPSRPGHTPGQLRRSITSKVEQLAQAIYGVVFSAGDVKYAAIHEFGGTTAAHLILPKRAQALAFTMGGKEMFFAKVNHPGSKMPERSYMRSSLTEMSTAISMGLKEAVVMAATPK